MNNIRIYLSKDGIQLRRTQLLCQTHRDYIWFASQHDNAYIFYIHIEITPLLRKTKHFCAFFHKKVWVFSQERNSSASSSYDD